MICGKPDNRVAASRLAEMEGIYRQEGGSETFPETFATFLSNDGTETGDETLEFSRVDL